MQHIFEWNTTLKGEKVIILIQYSTLFKLCCPPFHSVHSFFPLFPFISHLEKYQYVLLTMIASLFSWKVEHIWNWEHLIFICLGHSCQSCNNYNNIILDDLKTMVCMSNKFCSIYLYPAWFPILGNPWSEYRLLVDIIGYSFKQLISKPLSCNIIIT